jgi:hypothetical protein
MAAAVVNRRNILSCVSRVKADTVRLSPPFERGGPMDVMFQDQASNTLTSRKLIDLFVSQIERLSAFGSNDWRLQA